MNGKLLTAVFIVAPIICGCNGTGSERRVCKIENQCDNAVQDCMITMIFNFPLSGDYSSTSVHNNNTLNETESNDTWQDSNALGYFDPYTSTTITLSGSIGALDAADLFHAYTLSPDAVDVAVSSQGTATCNLYLDAALNQNADASTLGFPVDSGTLSSTPINVTLDNSHNDFLFIKCTGNAGDTYSLSLVNSAQVGPIDPNYASSYLQSIAPFVMMMCSTAMDDCKRHCNEKYKF